MKNDGPKDKKTFRKWMFPWLLCALVSDIMVFSDLCYGSATADLGILHAVNAVLFTGIAVYLIRQYWKQFGSHRKKG